MARLLALLVCALAQSNALVVSAHTGAVIRSGVSTPQQQLCSAPAATARVAQIVMAVPKKRQSKIKTRQRKANWFAKTRRKREPAQMCAPGGLLCAVVLRAWRSVLYRWHSLLFRDRRRQSSGCWFIGVMARLSLPDPGEYRRARWRHFASGR